MLTVIDERLIPTNSDVAFYREHGYWISAVIIPEEILTAAEHGQRRLYAGDFDHPEVLPASERAHGWTPARGDVLRKNDHSALVINELAQLVRYPVIAAIAARLGGHQGIRLWHDQLLYKPVEGDQVARVGWHTDRQYWMTCSSQDMLTAWVPFHDIEPEHGPVSFVDGSHRWFEEDPLLDFFSPDLSNIGQVLERHASQLAVSTMPRGAVSFHHCRTIHGSGANQSPEPRRSIAIHLQPEDNHYVDRPRREGGLHVHGIDQLVRRTADGVPDYADPVYCPPLWRTRM